MNNVWNAWTFNVLNQPTNGTNFIRIKQSIQMFCWFCFDYFHTFHTSVKICLNINLLLKIFFFQILFRFHQINVCWKKVELLLTLFIDHNNMNRSSNVQSRQLSTVITVCLYFLDGVAFLNSFTWIALYLKIVAWRVYSGLMSK